MAQTIQRTATFAWSRSSRGGPLLATGTVSGALDESFSNQASLELWDVFADDEEADKCRGRVPVQARFNRLAWNTSSDGRPEGVLAAGMDNGEVSLYDPAKILEGSKDPQETCLFTTDRHRGSVRGLAWNSLQPSLFASGATEAEIFIWDTKNLSKPYGPSANKSRHLTDITALAWNPSVAHILATASSSGSTVVWDLKGRQEVIHLMYQGTQGSVYSQGPKPVSSVCWHQERGTRVITASEDDGSPVILVWDLRNYRTPERVLSGHEKGILSLDWCKQDPELLFSCGKDCRTLAWNPSSGDMIGELPATTNWSFDVASCPRNPAYIAVAAFDGKISISSIQNTTVASPDTVGRQPLASDTAADIFSAGNLSNLAAQVHPGVSLKQPPRWLKRPVSSTFGFGGKLATTSSAAVGQTAAPGQPMQLTSRQVKVHQVVTEPAIIERAVRLDNAMQEQSLADFCDQKLASVQQSSGNEAGSAESWRLLSSLFRANSRDELVSLLNFSKAEVQQKVEQAIKAYKTSSGLNASGAGTANGKAASSASEDIDDAGSVAREPLVTFADQLTTNDALSGSSEGEGAASGRNTGHLEAAPSETEASVSGVSDATKVADSEMTEPSLFGDDGIGNNAQQQAAADFYSSISSAGHGQTGRPVTMADRFSLSQQNMERAGSSVAATIGSRPSSVASDNVKASTFRIYPQNESENDRLLTRALVLGDFDSAVSLCLSTGRFAEALLLAIRGGPALLAKTQTAYFERNTASLPYLRLFRSIVSNDLSDVVQNADLADWQEVFVVLCTFASEQEFPTLAQQLGQRLEYQYAVASTSGKSQSSSADAQRKSAVLCFLAAGKLEKVISIWAEEMQEEETVIERGLGASKLSASARYTAHAQALQSFIEKVTVFINANGYVDADLTQSAAPVADGSQSYKLAGLYDKYAEYSELLAAQGLASLAVRYASLIPAGYRSDAGGLSSRDRLQVPAAQVAKAAGSVRQQQQLQSQQYPQQQAYMNGAVPAASSSYQPTAPAPTTMPQNAYSSPYAPATNVGVAGPYSSGPSNPYAAPGPYVNASNGYASNAYGQSLYAPQQSSFAPPPQQQPAPAAIPPPPAKKAAPAGGWNDAPVLKRPASTTGNAAKAAVQPIFSPFPNASPTSPQVYGAPTQFMGHQSGGNVPPPPPSRGLTRTPAQQVAAQQGRLGPSVGQSPQQQHPQPQMPFGAPGMQQPQGPPGMQSRPTPPPMRMPPPQQQQQVMPPQQSRMAQPTPPQQGMPYQQGPPQQQAMSQQYAQLPPQPQPQQPQYAQQGQMMPPPRQMQPPQQFQPAPPPQPQQIHPPPPAMRNR